jgi:hypothetical protein
MPDAEDEVRMTAFLWKVYGDQHIGYRCCISAANWRHADANMHHQEER